MQNDILAGLPSQKPVRTESQMAASFAKVPVTLQVILGTARLPLSEILTLQAGSRIGLDQKLGEPVSIIVNGCMVASGQIFVMDDQAEKLGVKITEIFNSKEET